MTMIERERQSDAYMARAYLAQAAHVRRYPQHSAWHARLLEWAAKRRRQHAESLRIERERIAAPAITKPVQGDLFEGF
jgi:hypothetical protein